MCIRDRSYTDAVTHLHEIFNDGNNTHVRSSLKEEGFTIRQEADAIYALNFHSHILINLTEEGFDLNRLKPQRPSEVKRPLQPTDNHISHLIKLRDSKDGSRSEKREWEVGQKGSYDEVDDGRSMKR